MIAIRSKELIRENRDRAFTVTELLFTVSIILVLLGLGLAAVSKARARTNDVICRNNLRQIGLALQTYAQDNGGRLPDLLIGDNFATNLQRLLSVSSKSFWCRSDVRTFRGLDGSSYKWNQRFSNHLMHRIVLEELHGDTSRNALMCDLQPWHGHINGVFADNHIESWVP